MYISTNAIWSAHCKFCGKVIQLKSKSKIIDVVARPTDHMHAKALVQRFNKAFILSKGVKTDFI